MNNPFQPDNVKSVYNRKSIYNRIINTFKPVTKEEEAKDRQRRISNLDELKELLHVVELINADVRYQKLRKLRKDQLSINIELLKTTKSTDPNITMIQGQVQTLEEELDMTRIIKQQIGRIENESRT